MTTIQILLLAWTVGGPIVGALIRHYAGRLNIPPEILSVVESLVQQQQTTTAAQTLAALHAHVPAVLNTNPTVAPHP